MNFFGVYTMLLAHIQVEEDGHILFILEIPSEFFSDLNISTAGGLAREPNASFLSPAQICFNPANCLLFPVVAVWDKFVIPS